MGKIFVATQLASTHRHHQVATCEIRHNVPVILFIIENFYALPVRVQCPSCYISTRWTTCHNPCMYSVSILLCIKSDSAESLTWRELTARAGVELERSKQRIFLSREDCFVFCVSRRAGFLLNSVFYRT